jgi:MFS family permease
VARLNADSRRIIAAQGLGAAGYGFTAVLLGTLLAARDYPPWLVGRLLGCIVAGIPFGSLLFGRIADRVGRRRCYVAIFLGLALAGALMAIGPPAWVIRQVVPEPHAARDCRHELDALLGIDEREDTCGDLRHRR